MREKSAGKVLKDEDCFEIIRKKLRRESMEDFSLIAYEIVPIDEVNGYMGQYYTLKATVACPESPLETKNINFFTKTLPPTGSPQYDFIQEYGTFKKEVEIYTKMFPEVFGGHDKSCIPECFLGLENDVIVLEDMAHSGFGMTDKLKPFDLEHCKVLMKTLARFHAKSLLFEEQTKRSIREEFSHCMHETLWPLKNSGRGRALFDAAVKGILSVIDLMPDLTKDQQRTFKKKMIELSLDHAKKLLPSVKHKNVLCHGDLWANNILFKYNDDKKPAACCLIDFQLARYNPPAHDILCFLQFTTTRKLRRQHSKKLYEIYYESVEKALSEANLRISEIFPWNEFLTSIEDLRLMSMAHGVLNIPIMLLEPTAANKYFSEQPDQLESILYVDRTPMLCEQLKNVPEYRDRLMDALLELYYHVAD